MRKNNVVALCIFLLVIPLIVIGGLIIFKDKYYSFIALLIAIFSCLPMFWLFHKKKSSSKEIAILATMIALSVAGRFIFAWLPGFKPVTAIAVIVGVYLGHTSGFLVGSLSAVISNFYFGQGPWTPFQMFAWGVIGLLAGLLSKPLKANKMLLLTFGAISGVLFSLAMDIFTTLWVDGTFNFTRYLASVITALPITAEYAISNIIFLLLLAKPIGEKLDRVKRKYGLFNI